jgi:predicted MPP superfamily phosphohydrolase
MGNGRTLESGGPRRLRLKILIVQISDIHLKAPAGAVGDRASKVGRAVIAKAPKVDACYLVLTGDVADTGSPSQYSAARQFVERIKEELLEARFASVNVVAVPGNHDLNLATETDTRRFLLESLNKYLATKVDSDGSAFKSIISVQDDFFQFESDLSDSPPLANHEKLYYRRSFWTGDRSVVFHCFNTAWLSRRNEQQAKLFLPPRSTIIERPPRPTSALPSSITLTTGSTRITRGSSSHLLRRRRTHQAGFIPPANSHYQTDMPSAGSTVVLG